MMGACPQEIWAASSHPQFKLEDAQRPWQRRSITCRITRVADICWAERDGSCLTAQCRAKPPTPVSAATRKSVPLASSRRVQRGCPVWTQVSYSLESVREQYASAGSITSPTGSQKFETCPRWGAKTSPFFSTYPLLNTPFAALRARCRLRLRITHLCSNLLVFGHRGPPRIPPAPASDGRLQAGERDPGAATAGAIVALSFRFPTSPPSVQQRTWRNISIN